MKKFVLFAAMSWLLTLEASAQVALKSDGLDAKYVENILGRSQKIVDGLNISDAAKAESVRNIIANRYFLLNQIHDACNQTKQWAKSNLQDSERQHVMDDAERKRDAELYKHHFELQSALAAYLTDEQIDAVKDGMTFGRLKRDYGAQLDMIPSLTDEEKQQVLTWLREAREFAMDAGDSKQKHAWFDKYRGRTNNWLSARGYDLKKEREAWQKRIEEAKKK
ncbi:MAG: DUF3826 domain-containing protein [Prevotella sp.]|nr:DUF3826 domain-containing protein [Prevotella sp.]